MDVKRKLAVFDFCETLANFQTADAYVKFIGENFSAASYNKVARIHSWLYNKQIVRIINKLFPRLSFNKRLWLLRLRGYSQNMLEDLAKRYYNEVVKPNLIGETIAELRSKQKEGYRIIIASGGYYDYLKFFADDFNIPHTDVIAVSIKFKDGVCCGTFTDGDRLWDKPKQLDGLLKGEIYYKVAYSDSMSDLPMLKWADDSYVVRRVDKSWATEMGFKEILWKKFS